MAAVKMVIVVRKDLNMRKGKMCAQVAHASMKFITDQYEPDDVKELLAADLTETEQRWLLEGTAKIVVSVDSDKQLGELIGKATRAGIRVHAVTDAGRTEFHGVPTRTCAAFGPDESEKLDEITGDLVLL